MEQQKQKLTEDSRPSTFTTAWRYSSSDFEPTMKFLNKIDWRELQNPLSLLEITSLFFKFRDFLSLASPPSSVLKALHSLTENRSLLWPKPTTPEEGQEPNSLLSNLVLWLLKLSGKRWSLTSVAMDVVIEYGKRKSS